jgi:iron complex transport system ATP-binding protein
VITVTSLTVTIGGRDVVAEVSFQVRRAGWLMLIGPNGAGKTSLLRAIAGLVPHQGRIEIGRRTRSRLSRREAARLIAYVSQRPQLPAAMTVHEYALRGRVPHLGYLGRTGEADDHAVTAVLERHDLGGLASRRLETLSGGERQRAVLARALAQDAPVLLLDEPTASLDVGRQQDVLDMVADLRCSHGLTVIGALHDLTLAGQYADDLVLLDGGRVAARGPTKEVLRESLLNEHYRARLRVGAPPGHGLVVTPLPPPHEPGLQQTASTHDVTVVPSPLRRRRSAEA